MFVLIFLTEREREEIEIAKQVSKHLLACWWN